MAREQVRKSPLATLAMEAGELDQRLGTRRVRGERGEVVLADKPFFLPVGLAGMV